MRSAKQLLVWLILLLFLLLWFAPPSLAAPDQEQEIKRNIEIYKSPSYSLKERGDAIRRLMEIGQPAIPALIQALKDEKVRYTATSTLGEIGPAAQDAVPAMVAAFRKADQFDRGNAASALLKIVRPEKNMDQAALQHKILQLQNLREAIFKDFSEPPYKDLRDQLDLMYLQEKQPPAWVAWVEKHKLQQKWWAWAVAGYAVLLILCLPTWLLLLWLQPLWLYWLNEKVSSWSFKGKYLERPIGLHQFFFLSPFYYCNRVLDAWVQAYLSPAWASFTALKTVQDRAVHVPVPLTLNGHTRVQPTPADFQEVFRKTPFCLLIWGEGGSGKTSLACQLAIWAMAGDSETLLAGHPLLPVLIEHDLTLQVETGQHPLLEAVRKQVELMTGAKEITSELLRHLLRRQRLLVIVDHFSELSPATRERIQTGHDPKLTINAMIVTSRQEEQLQDAVTDKVKPMRIKGTRLSSFMEAYLTQLGKRELYDDMEFFDACIRLSKMVGDRNITVLLARLYADQMIATKEDPAFKNLPDNIPDLMLFYLNLINRHKSSQNPGNRAIQRIAKAISLVSLSPTFRPTDGSLAAIQAALAGEEDLEQKFQYLCRNLGIIQFIGPAEDKVRVSLDPLAEYLAGLRILELYGADKEQWRAFLEEADKKEGSPLSIEGFLLAVRDCCQAKGKETGVPDFVVEELGRRTDFDPEALQKAQLKQRLVRLVSTLSTVPEAEDRRIAAETLGKIGPSAVEAIPALIQALQDEDVDLRQTASEALGKIGPAAVEAVPAIIKALNDKNFEVRKAAADALAKIGPDAASSVPTLIKSLQDIDESVRRAADQALKKIGPADVNYIPKIVELLRHGNAGIKIAAVRALEKIGPAAAVAVPAFIKALKEEDVSVKMAAAGSLGKIGASASNTVPALIQSLQKDLIVRRATAGALGNFGPAAVDAVPDLIQVALNDKDRIARRAAAEALGKISQSGKVIQALIQVLQDDDRDVWRAAAGALAKIGPAAAGAVPALIPGLHDKYSGIRKATIKALGNFGPAAAVAVPALILALGDKDGEVAGLAVDALRKIGPAAVDAIPDLIRALGNTDGDIRQAAAYALGKIGPAAEDAVPVLIQALRDQIWYVSNAAAQALGEMGPAAREAVTPLEEACEDPKIKESAEQALQKIMGKKAD